MTTEKPMETREPRFIGGRRLLPPERSEWPAKTIRDLRRSFLWSGLVANVGHRLDLIHSDREKYNALLHQAIDSFAVDYLLREIQEALPAEKVQKIIDGLVGVMDDGGTADELLYQEGARLGLIDAPKFVEWLTAWETWQDGGGERPSLSSDGYDPESPEGQQEAARRAAAGLSP